MLESLGRENEKNDLPLLISNPIANDSLLTLCSFVSVHNEPIGLRSIFIESDPDATEALGRHQLVEGLAGGGEGSLGVVQDPVHLLSHSVIESSSMCSKFRLILIFHLAKPDGTFTLHLLM